MTLLEIFTGEENLFIEEHNKKYKKNLLEINKLLNETCKVYADSRNYFASNQTIEKIALAKGLTEYFAYAKKLHLENALNNLDKIEKDKISNCNALKTKLITAFNAIQNPEEAIVCAYNIQNDELVKCEEGKEVIIYGEHNNIINNIISLIESLYIEGNFEKIPANPITFNRNTMDENVQLCKETALKLYQSKVGKLTKISNIIEKLEESSIKVVAFYTFKEVFENIGCNPKDIKDYENELSKEYIPLKKTLQKDLKIELQEICNVSINENEYPAMDISEEETATETNSTIMENLISNSEEE